MEQRLFYGNDNNINSSDGNQLVARYILERFTNRYNNFTFTMNGTGIISQGLFMIQSVSASTPNVRCIKDGHYDLGNLHFIPTDFRYWEGRAIRFANASQNPENYPENAYVYAVNRLSFNVGCNNNCNLYTNKILRTIYNIFPNIIVNSYTNCRTRDMWPSTPHTFPVISTWGGTGEGATSFIFPHIQQSEFSVNIIDSKIINIGEKGWGKKTSTVIGTHKTFGSGTHNELVTADYCDGTTDAAAAMQQLINKAKEPTRNVIFLDEFVKADNTGRLQCQNAGMCNGYENFDRTTITYQNISNANLGTYAGVFYNNKFFDLISDVNHERYKDLIGVPVLFTKIGGAGTYGSYNEWIKNEHSLLYMVGICTCAAKIFSTSDENYSDFNIYYTKNPNSENPDEFKTLNISYAIDLRPLSTGGSAVIGKVKINEYTASTDILAIANKNIYILSSSQLNTYITAPNNIDLDNIG